LSAYGSELVVKSRLRLVVLLTATALAGVGASATPRALAGGTGRPPRAEGPASQADVLPGRGAVASPAAMAARGPSAGCLPVPSGAARFAPGVPGGAKTIALTFDDGPGSRTTPGIIAVLRRYGVPATFFNIGENEATYPSYVREEVTLGFLVGNHTWNHPDMARLPASAQAWELSETTAEQEALTGWGPCVFRPPYGSYDAATLSLARARDLRAWTWSVDTEDWKAAGSASSYWVNRIIALAESEGGALPHPVVLMHNMPVGNPATLAALPVIISYFRARGYTFVNLAGSTGTGYQAASAGGGVVSFGAAGYGPAAGRLPAGVTAAGLATDPGTGGYWLLASNGAVRAYHAPSLGSAAGELPPGVTATAIAASRGGYLVLASDGSVYAFGAPLHGSARGRLPAGTRAVGIAADAATGGYWIVASDGWTGGFGVPGLGSLSGKLAAGETATAIAASPQGGYLILTSAGRVAAFRGQPYGGVAGKLPAGVTAVALAIAPATGGYWILESNGTVAAFRAPARGSLSRPAGGRAAAIAGA
jgi:peptidoglycan/xylan/chitin deacetylase (PgdA/CDA1 family)